ncbi:MAG: N-acetyl-gamma-glutamyl-phosphate reductase [Saprospiraceae bacterium]|nr:N-acetyl-gamma-glutamyl-phosphate reductase [Saprospiraceae bacterium]
MINVGIFGAAGYTGGELLRILRSHPDAEIDFIHSQSQVDKHVAEVHQDLFDLDLRFTDQISSSVNVVFLCMGHGRSSEFMSEHALGKDVRIIDLSHDFRIKGSHDFVYGLPELQKQAIAAAKYIANPGCFATGIQLALLPLADAQEITDDIHITAMTGSTGAGQKPTPTGHFSWRNNNISVYKAFKHQHLAEIKQSLLTLQPEFNSALHFVPMRGNFTRGILASIYTQYEASEDIAINVYKSYYGDHPFVHITDTNPNLKQVVNTNTVLLHIKKHRDLLHIISISDNLIKGAAGQAVQNMNLMFGLPEQAGLQLKPVGF